jgi:hypothetical protein
MNWERHFRNMNRKARVQKNPLEYSKEYSVGFGSDFGAPVFSGFFDDAWNVITTPIDKQVAAFTLASDNLTAANAYIHATPAITTNAKSLASDWARWWDATGNPSNYTLIIPPAVWDEARNRKLAYDLANAKSQDEVDLINHTAKTGMSTEQMQGLPDRRDPTTGTYFVPPPPPPPFLPPWVKPVAIGAVALGLGLSVVPMIRKLVFPI